MFILSEHSALVCEWNLAFLAVHDQILLIQQTHVHLRTVDSSPPFVVGFMLALSVAFLNISSEYILNRSEDKTQSCLTPGCILIIY